MVIWHAFRMEEYRIHDHPYHAAQFRPSLSLLRSRLQLVVLWNVVPKQVDHFLLRRIIAISFSITWSFFHFRLIMWPLSDIPFWFDTRLIFIFLDFEISFSLITLPFEKSLYVFRFSKFQKLQNFPKFTPWWFTSGDVSEISKIGWPSNFALI